MNAREQWKAHYGHFRRYIVCEHDATKALLHLQYLDIAYKSVPPVVFLALLAVIAERFPMEYSSHDLRRLWTAETIIDRMRRGQIR